MKFKRSIYNIVNGFGGQLLLLILGIVIPKLFINEYGSEVNGLFSSLNQVFTYVALIEAGVGAATVQALYQPIILNDKKGMLQILSATKMYYKRISLYYLICIICVSIIYPLVTTSSINKLVILLIVLLQGLSGVINFYFQATLIQLLTAEGKNYVISNITMLVQIMTSVTKIVLILNSANIIFIQLSYFGISILQMLFYYLYFRKHYNWVDLKVKPNFDALKQKNSFLVHQVSLLIFSSTDILILSIFCDFKVASVFTVYNLIIMSLNILFNTIFNGFSFILGHTFHENKKEYIKLHDAFETYYIAFIFAMMSVCYLLFLPFIKIYTKGITDINYVDYYLPFLFCVMQLLSSTRMVSNNLIRIAGHMKQTIPRSILEATINLGVSLILVKAIGIYGVLFGTIVALMYRTNDIIIYANIKILNRSPIKKYIILFINCFLFAVIMFINRYVSLDSLSYLSFLIKGIVVFTIILPVYFVINSFVDIKSFKYLSQIIKPKFQRLLKTPRKVSSIMKQ